jgi:hypothetical protein
MKLTPKEKTEKNGKFPRIGDELSLSKLGFRGLKHLGIN